MFPDKNTCAQKDTSEVDSSRPNEFAMTKGIAEGNKHETLVVPKYKRVLQLVYIIEIDV